MGREQKALTKEGQTCFLEKTITAYEKRGDVNLIRKGRKNSGPLHRYVRADEKALLNPMVKYR